MPDLIKTYIDELDRDFRTGKATEHSHRPALKRLLESMLDGIQAINEPKHIDCGAPDYIVTRKDIPVGYIEAKDIGKDLNHKDFKGQFDRYKQSLDNLIITDYLDFRRYMKGELVDSVRIADVKGNKITLVKANLGHFEQFIKDFGLAHPQGITSPAEIARMMAGKARLMAEIIKEALKREESDNALLEQMNAFKEVLIHDIKPEQFADVYAQTITYGLFAARLHDKTPDTFSRQNAASLIPKTNPFLRQLFDNIAGLNLDDRIAWIVDDLADTFRAANMTEFKQNFGDRAAQNDPMIHFYEDFLSAYDPILRKSRGVWYTPQAVVTFIVRAVDEILQKEFNLPTGLADTSKTKIKINGRETDVHKVQILDPATGTGTFLAETITRIYEKFRKQGGMWQKYVKEHLIPRLNGFEVLMASYTMAHIKLEQLLSQTGYDATDNQRLRIYLTNSLEEQHPETGSFFAQFLAKEANEANSIKRDTPVMVVLGNPPYSGISQNNGEWITGLIDHYKYVDGEYFNERKHWLNDDYVKFIRLGQEFVSKNNEGILAYINNHSFIDNPTFRGMRWNLMKTFDKIYIFDLHGNAKKNEVCPDGSKDENVFDIQQGVSINIFVKTGRKAKEALAEIYHADLFGKQEVKYKYLVDNSLSTVQFVRVAPVAPFYFFCPKDESNKGVYEQGFRIDELMQINVTGIVTARDSLVIDMDKKDLLNRITDFSDFNNSDDEIRHKYSLKDSRGWKLPEARKTVSLLKHKQQIKLIDYRPFDTRYIYYHPKMVDWGREKVMRHFFVGENVGLITCRQAAINSWELVNITRNIVDDSFVSNRTKERGYVFPLYIYPNPANALPDESRRPNLDGDIVSEISKRIGLQYIEEDDSNATKKSFTPIDLLDYIYAVLHSPTYREKYKEFLKIDFPRIPYPENAAQFRALSKLGGKLRRLHLLDGVEPQEGTADYPVPGNDEVEKIQYDEADRKVFINKKQFFDNVPREAWEFYIGGYQPAQKWLKDRKGRVLSYDDTLHYRRIITVLLKTIEIMEEIKAI
jgi:predicted helicase